MPIKKRKESGCPIIQFTHDTILNVLDWINLPRHECNNEQHHQLKSSGGTNDCWTFYDFPQESGIN